VNQVVTGFVTDFISVQ